MGSQFLIGKFQQVIESGLSAIIQLSKLAVDTHICVGIFLSVEKIIFEIIMLDSISFLKKII